MQLEGNVSGDQIDESYAWVSGAFGQIIIGTENSAMYKMHVSPSDFGIGVNSGDAPSLDQVSHGWADEVDEVRMGKITGGWMAWRRPFGSTNVEPGNDNDSGKLSYFTPRIEGLQLGVSYAGDPTDDNADPGGFQNREGGKNGMVAVGLNFARAFEGASVNASFGYGAVDSGGPGDSPTAMSGGLKVNVGGFGAGASYGQSEDDGAVSGAGYNVGVNYTTGPMGVSLVYFHGEQDGAPNAAGINQGHGVHDTVMLSGKYAMGPGITLKWDGCQFVHRVGRCGARGRATRARPMRHMSWLDWRFRFLSLRFPLTRQDRPPARAACFSCATKRSNVRLSERVPLDHQDGGGHCGRPFVLLRVATPARLRDCRRANPDCRLPLQ